ncbi:metal-dependent phosphohydrolase [Vibrio astriarenae]|nr:metal-dependent phosphohydrolase [Vibrio sp. C7]
MIAFHFLRIIKRFESSKVAAEKALRFLANIGYPQRYFKEIEHAIISHSFSANIKPETLEAQIVQDADRLDALGAIGIARCIQVSSGFGVGLYSQDDPFCEHRKPNDKENTVDHFYTKLFKLEDMMNTVSAKEEAHRRSNFMRDYLRQLGEEL